jgi:hypothetical protein
MKKDLRTPACVGLVVAVLYFAGFLYSDWPELRARALLTQLMVSLTFAAAVTWRGRKWWTMMCLPFFSSRLGLYLRTWRFKKSQQDAGSGHGIG